MDKIRYVLHFMHRILMPNRHRQQALMEIEAFEGDVETLYTYMNTWYSHLLRDLEVVGRMIRLCGGVIQYFPELQEMRPFVLDAVRNDGRCLKFCPAFQNDWQVVFEAISETGYAYRYASEELQSNTDIMCQTLRTTPSMLMDLKISDREYRHTIMAIGGEMQLFSVRVQRLAKAVYKHHEYKQNDNN